MGLACRAEHGSQAVGSDLLACGDGGVLRSRRGRRARAAIGAALLRQLFVERAGIVGDAAGVALDENILSDEAGATATVNLFVRNGTGWRMVLHQASQVVIG